jgi:hypothetical protein
MPDVQIQILAEVTQANARLQQLETRLAGVKDESNKLGDAWKTAKSAAAGFTIAAIGVEKILGQTLGKAISYNKTVLDSARAARIGTEEMSRMIQAADDYGISMEQVTSTMELAQKRGFAPTIDNLAKLADETNAIVSPTERAARLAEVLGRNWAALDPLLQQGGDAIRKLTASVEDGLVVTEEEAKATEEMRLNIDELSDSWEAAKLSAGNFVAQGLNPIIAGYKGLTSALEEQGDRLTLQAPTYAAYLEMWDQQGVAMKLFGDILTEAEFNQAHFAATTQAAAEHMDTLARKSEEAGGVVTGVTEALATIPALTQSEIDMQLAINGARATFAAWWAIFLRTGEGKSINIAANIEAAAQEKKPKTGGPQEFAGGGSFIVPGSGSGDRPYTLGLEPGERVDITPRSEVNNNNSRNLTWNGNINNGLDRAGAEQMFRRIMGGE